MSQFQVFTLQNSKGLTLKVTNFGGKIMSLIFPDKNGALGDIVLGYSTPEEYRKGNPYFGALIGRYANRISKGKFSLDDKHYQLPLNNGINCLHGGDNGFHNVFWVAKQPNEQQLHLSYVSKDGEEGFPGELRCEVFYSVNQENELTIEYYATTNKTTVVNFTHHSFFNLKGAGNGDILDHRLTLHAEKFCAVDENLIPTGVLTNVANSPFDFLNPFAIGSRVNQANDQLKKGRGYDHCWVLMKNNPNKLTLAAEIKEPESGRMMQIWTTQPGVQFYSGNFLDGSDVGREGSGYGFRSAFCIEPQHFPDSPNHPQFPTTTLQPHEKYYQKSIYKFGVNTH